MYLKIITGHKHFPIIEKTTKNNKYLLFLDDANILSVTHNDEDRKYKNSINLHFYNDSKELISQIINDRNIALLNLQNKKLDIMDISELVLKGVKFEIIKDKGD
jgi:hypothetical protein